MSPGEAFTRAATSSPSQDLKSGESWVEIWSRLPVLKKDLRTTDSEFTAAATVVLPDGTHLVVFGTVLPWRGQKWKEHPSAGAVAFEAALGAHEKDWQRLAREESASICVAGDFNQDLSCKHFYWSRRAYSLLRDSLDGRRGLIATTRDPTDPVRKLTNGAEACIDHICLSPEIEARKAGKSRAWSPVVDGRVLSDHPGVLIELADT